MMNLLTSDTNQMLLRKLGRTAGSAEGIELDTKAQTENQGEDVGLRNWKVN